MPHIRTNFEKHLLSYMQPSLLKYCELQFFHLLSFFFCILCALVPSRSKRPSPSCHHYFFCHAAQPSTFLLSYFMLCIVLPFLSCLSVLSYCLVFLLYMYCNAANCLSCATLMQIFFPCDYARLL